jgi:hypothetical protein
MVGDQAIGDSASTSSFDEQHRRETNPTVAERTGGFFKRFF